MTSFRERSRAGFALGLLLAGGLLAPLLGGGVVLTRDMVFVPGIPLDSQLLGLDGVPRAVPSDLLVALGSRLLPVGWFQDLVLVGLVVLAAWGAARLAPTSHRFAALAGGTAYGWSAYLHERLLLGQWALLLGWAVLPWAAGAALAWRRGESGWPTVAWLALSAVGGASSVLLVGLVVVVCGRPLRALAALVVLSLPWALPALLNPVRSGDPAGVAAFSAKADTPFGVVGSLLTGGGVWSQAFVPPGRSAGSAVAAAVLLVAALGLPALRLRGGNRLLAAGAVGLALALLGAFAPTAAVLRWAVVHVPATGLLRDGQKWVAPLVLLVSAAFACGAERLASGITPTPVRRLAAALLVLAPLAALPGAFWAEGGRLQQTTIPSVWHDVGARTEGPVLVLPWGLYRTYPWNSSRTSLGLAVKLLVHPVVDDRLQLSTGQVRGEDPLAARLDAEVRAGGPLLAALQREGIRYVLVERSVDRAADTTKRQVEGLSVVRETDELALYVVPGSATAPVGAPWVPVLLGDLLAAATGATAVLRAVRGRRPYVDGYLPAS